MVDRDGLGDLGGAVGAVLAIGEVEPMEDDHPRHGGARDRGDDEQACAVEIGEPPEAMARLTFTDLENLAPRTLGAHVVRHIRHVAKIVDRPRVGIRLGLASNQCPHEELAVELQDLIFVRRDRNPADAAPGRILRTRPVAPRPVQHGELDRTGDVDRQRPRCPSPIGKPHPGHGHGEPFALKVIRRMKRCRCEDGELENEQKEENR